MPHLVENLANLTTHKDRDELEVALVLTIKDLLAPLTIAICRIVGERDDERWFTCTFLGPGERVPKTDSAWNNRDILPRLSDHLNR